MKAVIIMGSKSDLDYGKRIAEKVRYFGIDVVIRIASAHKTPVKVLEILKEYEDEDVVFITVAGRSNALSGFVDANTSKPVLASPPPSENWFIDIFSSIRMPSGVSPMLVMGAENVALAVAKIFSIKSEEVRRRVEEYQRVMKEKIERDDEVVRWGV